jgi:nitrous oxidase accessory protein
MNQNTKKVIALTVILLSATWMINFQFSSASKTLNVPGDYPTISEAIAHASDGDTIAVQSGVYRENLQVNKSITIIGENSANTILIGSGGLDRGACPVVALNAEGAKISGFTITSQNYTNTAQYATGIIVRADHCIIQENIIQGNYMGIFCSVQSYLEISGNTIAGNLKDGMRFYGGSYNTISGNTILGNAVSGLALQGYSNTVINNTFEHNLRALGLGSSYSVVFGNKMAFNSESAIWLAASESIIAANDISQNKWGIYITPQMGAPHDNTFYHNNFVDNTYAVYVNESTPTQFWDNGAQSGGNYWSDYQTKYPNAKEIDTSGIANTPYLVYSGAQDNYPLATKFDTSNLGAAPAANPTPVASNGLVAYWSFDTVDSNGVSPDSTGNNPAVLGSTTAIKSYIPKTMDGEVGKALAFDGQQYINVPASPSLEISGEATVDAWINVQDYKPIPYNNIIVEALRTTDALPTRTFGLAINGEEPQNSSALPLGALRGYIQTKDGLNEIATIQPVVTLNQWIHVVFTRSLTTGMHIYVNGQEQEIKVTAGVANPQGATLRQTETYIGHDAICTIDELKLSNLAQSAVQPFWTQWWLWAIIFAAIVVSGMAFLSVRHVRNSKRHAIS